MAISKVVEPPISLTEIKKLYARYNKSVFGGILPDVIPIRITASLKTSGKAKTQITSKYRKGHPLYYRAATHLPHSLAIELSPNKNTTEDKLIGILLHEMIHIRLYIDNEFEDDHGPLFENWRKKAEQITGYDIPVTEQIKLGDQNFHDTEIGLYVIEDNGRYKWATVSSKALRHALKDTAFHQNKRDYREKYGIGGEGTLYLTNDRLFIELSASLKCQRRLDGRTKLYTLRDKNYERTLVDALAGLKPLLVI